MNYIGFENELKELVKKELGRDVQISFEVVEKNNGKSEESIVFYKQKECSQIVVGLPGLYEIYRTTENMRYSFERILDILRRGERISVDEAFCDWERIKGLISMRLINLEWNRNRLKGLAYKEFFNLAVTFHVGVCQSEESTINLIVSREMMKSWGITADDLWETVMSNLKQEEFQIHTLREMILSLKRWGSDSKEESSEIIYVLTNRNNVYGAVGMFRIDMLSELAERLEKDLYIIPSSLHEVMLVPDREGIEAQELKNMLKTVNTDIVLKEEWLSNELYYFSREGGVITMIQKILLE